MLSSVAEYSRFIQDLISSHPSVEKSTLTLYTVGPQEATLSGELHFGRGIVLRVVEAVDFRRRSIRRYSYAVWHYDEKLYWYDPQPHPGNVLLAATFPHHKHIPPDIKHNRIPAPGLRFDRPNLIFLVEEIERTLLTPP